MGESAILGKIALTTVLNTTRYRLVQISCCFAILFPTCMRLPGTYLLVLISALLHYLLDGFRVASLSQMDVHVISSWDISPEPV